MVAEGRTKNLVFVRIESVEGSFGAELRRIKEGLGDQRRTCQFSKF